MFLGLFAFAAPPAAAQTPAIAFGTRHAVALRNNGDVLTWGDNVGCQLGRASRGNYDANPALVMRNAKEIAAASDHALVLTLDGKVYGWGTNPQGELGVGDEYDKCEGPVLVESLADKTITHIGTGSGFSVAVTSTGDLYCTGDNSMLQCPTQPRTGETLSFARVPFSELAGNVEAVAAGQFHTLVLGKDGRLYAFGRGRDGQLGNGKTANGFVVVDGMNDVVSMAAGTWHSVVARADGSVWTWGNGVKSQLCDAGASNRTTPSQVALPAGTRVVRVAAGGHSTMLQAAAGTVIACGDNQVGQLGFASPAIGSPTAVTLDVNAATMIGLGGAHAAVSSDGCTVLVAGDAGSGMRGGETVVSRRFVPRAGLSLCGSKAPSLLPDLVTVAPKGGRAGCWAPSVEEDASTAAAFASLRRAMLSAEGLLTKNSTFMTALEPVRYRSSLSAGPGRDGGARLHVKVVPERKLDGTRLWTADCGITPHLDRIGGAISQISVFFNQGARGQFLGSAGQEPKRTGTVAGYPEYNGWILITKDGRLPWIPVTLAERLDAEGSKRQRALDEWRRTRDAMKSPDLAQMQKAYEAINATDPAGAEKMMTSLRAQKAEHERLQQSVYPRQTASLEKQVADFASYKATFSPEQLRAPAVWGDASGEGRKLLEREIASLRVVPPALQAQMGRDARNRHMETVGPEITELQARYELTNLGPGDASRAMTFKPDPSFPSVAAAERIQVIAISFSSDPNPKNTARREWQQRVKETFDFAALAALLD